MIAMKAKPVSAPERYVDSVDAEIDQLKQGRFKAPLWLQDALAILMEEALEQYLRNQSCTVGMYMKDHVISPPPEATPRWRRCLTRRRPEPSLSSLLARHGLKAQTTTNGVSLVFLREKEWLQLLKGEIT